MSYQDDQTPTTEKTNESAEHAAYDAARVLRLHEHIEQLHAERRPEHGTLNAEDAQVYGMAALLHAAAPGAADPDPTFAASLLARLEREAGAMSSDHPQPLATLAAPPHAEAPTEVQALASVDAPRPPVRWGETAPRAGRSRAGVSRRGLLVGGLGAAAAAVVGAATGAIYERQAQNTPPGPNNTALVPDGRGAWASVAAVEAIPLGAVRHFQTEYIVGFIHHTEQGFTALSGVCTHMSCLLVWNGGARTFDCPCHGGRFSEDGHAAPESSIAYSPLPSIKTKVEQGQVWVYVIPPVTPATTSTPDDTPGGYTR
ncbi:MAG: Rieske 2Fe-2S domain-containing protein [Ktedonobacterales bacterium]